MTLRLFDASATTRSRSINYTRAAWNILKRLFFGVILVRSTASLSTTCAESIVGGNDDGSVLFSSCINYTVIPHASTAIKLTTEPYDQFCCGLCTIQYPQAVLYHWPARRTNTWCDQIRSTLKKEGVGYGGADNPLPEIDTSIYQNAMGLDPEIGGADALDNDGNLRGPYTRPPQSGAYAVAQDGFVFISPSIYVVFPIILATNKCGVVGNAYTSWTLGVPEHQLSTYQEYYGAKAFDPADLGCPHPLENRDLDDPGLTDAAEDMDPSILLPASLTDLDPAWKRCSLLPLALGRDPPRALEPAKNLAPKATKYQAITTTAPSVPYPHSVPRLPGPDPTSSSLPTENRPSSVPKDTAGGASASPQKLPSVCSPFPRSRTESPASAGALPPEPSGHGSPSQRREIRPRNEAASTADRKTPSGLPLSGPAFVSATSYPSYASDIDAWASDMDSEASVMQVPPVAPSNPYMVLPKHRSAKPTHILTLTGYPFPPNSSESRTTSEPEASTSLVELPVPSAIYQSTPSPPSAKAPTNQLGLPPPQSVPPALPDPNPNPTEDGDARSEDCGQDVVVNVAVTTRDADTEVSPAVQTSRQSATPARLSTQRRSSLGPDGASLPASSLSSIESVGRGLSSTVVPQANVSSYASSVVASVKGISATTTTSSSSAGGPGIFAAGFGSSLWIAFGLMVFALFNEV